MLPRRYRLILALFLLPTMLLACNLGKRSSPSEREVPVSQEAADRLTQKLKESIDQEDGDAFSLEVTETELTSYVNLKLAEQIDRSEDVPLEDFQVQFVEGQMLSSGKLTTVCPLSINVKVAASARVEDGTLDINLSKAQMGILPLPKILLRSLSRVINETIAEAPERMERAVEITELQIGDGVMQISGRITESNKKE